MGLVSNVAALAAAAVVGCLASGASAALYHFDFSGTADGPIFTSYPLDAQNAGVQSGDPVRLKFDLDSSVANSGGGALRVFTGAVKNINYSFPTRGLTYTPAAATFQIYPLANGPAYYRWDVRLPSQAPSETNTFTLSFWFRENTFNLPTTLPETIDASQFNVLHGINIFRGDPFGGGSNSLGASITNTIVPEPTLAAALTAGVAVALRRRRQA